MCGIAGVIHADPQKPVDPRNLVAMAAIQHHRGPDGFGYKVQDDRGVGFSHARLTIIDLDENRGRQPFLSEDRHLMLAVNGELYDYKRIRTELTSRGAKFRTKSDSEMVLHLYQRQGLEDMLPHLRGEFAIALYDRQRDRLMLIRDRFGVKPLYWTEVNGSVVFGSELKVLFAHPDVPRRFESQGLYHQLMQTMVPGSTAFEGIHQVKPGHVVTIERRHGKFQIRDDRYWDMDFPLQSERGEEKDEDFYIEGIREKLMEAVQLRLEADVPVACYLSGGIDSCITLGLSAAHQQSAVKAFTIGFDNADYDETAIAQEMARSVGADQDIMRLDAGHLYDNLVETLWHAERTIYNTLGVAKLLMSRHVNRAGYRVVVTGEGSDELFAGYPSFRRDMFLHGLDTLSPAERAGWEQLLAESNQLFKGAMLAENELHDPALDALVGFTPSCLQPWLASAAHAPGLMAAHHRDAVRGYEPGRAIAEALDGDMIEGRHPLDKAQYVWIKTMLEGQILTWGGDRVDMANSMEARPPFLDHHLADLAVHLPPSMRIKGRTEKYVLREAMKGLLPKVLYEREKFAFMAPPAHTDPKKWAAMKALADQYLSDQAIQDAGLLDPAGVKTLFALHEDPDTSTSTQVQLDAVINHMIGVQVLHSHFVAQDIPALARRRAEELGWRV
ncbi:asparagine synthase (glutamine-hydrolyzing) [Ectothiorhodospira lacustris]|uniref:asparagine synthase (glutamine-hydrolyzing) n=1 Tax=Ectothiorhodospira lacustris TaxID=2899127 RepID=UPI001EE7EB14|nr:asparagine synthase (glutamine-hydrolyzing) [Ectothiorhodospira lacustris]MCG5499252.1 asparagine synthase (glutamine-hydrolyzing) [Ectothiorhodospira lacustris]MCG5509746.1 asparagine synthase (glutamine-hydrolyzing) [Ectothiorhodospira lacustris]MCG5522340.1 asparagine synthase (glutamine-hydrolyzing) [Ectothiorhodospira lacustris]